MSDMLRMPREELEALLKVGKSGRPRRGDLCCLTPANIADMLRRHEEVTVSLVLVVRVFKDAYSAILKFDCVDRHGTLRTGLAWLGGDLIIFAREER
jgi:hypothetical protein